MTISIGKIEKVDLREIWKHEATDFTRWLVQNIDYLNDVLDLDIVVRSVEENVGPFRVDIFGEDSGGNKIIIENQLEKTDHGHLGQILTYLVNLEANIAVWVTSKPVEEHRQVIEWLNETTPDDMYFYLVQVEGIRIAGQEKVAPLFTVVEGPTVERKRIGDEKKEYALSHSIRREFWTQFIDEMNKVNTLCQNVSPTISSWIPVALGKSGVSMSLVVTKNYARTEIFINRGDSEENKKIFDYFYNQKEEIEREFGNTLTWI